MEGGIFGPNLVMRKEEIAGGRRCTLTQNAEVSNKNRVNDTLLSYFSSSTKYSKNCFFNLFVDTVLGTYGLTLAKNRPLGYIFLQYNVHTTISKFVTSSKNYLWTKSNSGCVFSSRL